MMNTLIFLLFFHIQAASSEPPSDDSAPAKTGPEIIMEVESPEESAQNTEETSEDKKSPIKTDGLVLPEVTVEGEKAPGQDDTADATHVSGDKLRDSPRGSTLEAISQETADVYVSGRGSGVHGVSNGASGAIHVRGLGGSPNAQVLVVEDGVPDVQGIFGHPLPDAYVPFLIGEVRVVKGGDSTLYGSNALGGVILIENRWRLREGFEIENDAAYGSFQSTKETLSLLGRWGDWDLASAFHYYRTDGHRDNAGGYNMVGATGVRWRILPDLKLTLKDKVIHLEGEDPGPATHPNTGHWYDVWRNNLSLRLDYRQKWFDFRTLSYLNVGVHRLYDGFYSEDYTAGLSTEADIHPHKTLDLLVGLSATWIEGEVLDRLAQVDDDDDEEEDVKGLANYAFYNQLTWKPLKSLSFVVGSRELYSTKYGFALLYKGGAKWEFYEGLSLRSRITRNFRQPTLRELYLPFPTSNPDLKPEYSLNWDAGFGLDYRHVEFSFSTYRTQAENMIKYFGSWPSAEVVNIDEIVIWGVEGRFGLKELGPVNMFVTGNWQDVGRYTKQNPDAKVNFTVEAAHDFGEHRLSGSVSGEWVHGLYMENYSREPIDNVFFMDATLRYRYEPSDKDFQLEPYLLLRNILDLRYEYIENYPMPGFNVMAGLKVRI